MSFQAKYTENSDDTFSGGSDNPLIFDQILRDDLPGYDPTTGIFIVPYTGTYVFNVDYEVSGTSLVSACEIKVEGVETPITLNENKTTGRIILTLDAGRRVWVEFRGVFGSPGFRVIRRHFSGCLLHKSA